MPFEARLTPKFERKVTRFLKKHPDLKDRYQKCLRLLQENPFHPSLRLHKLQGQLSEYHSVSATLSYQMVIEFVIQDEQIIPIDIGTHEDVY